MPYYHQLIAASVLLCFGMVACQLIVPTLPDTVSLAEKELGWVSSGLAVRIDSIQDSRCPAKVQCFWAGLVEVKVSLSMGTDSRSVNLILQPGQQLDTTQVTLGTDTYKVMLRNVVPHPVLGSTVPRKATVQVTPM
jgi:hypothetical protein